MPECEFKKLCDEVMEEEGDCVFAKYDEIKACDDRKMFKRTFDSPQFKKQYAEKIRKAIDDFREELVEAIIAFDENEMPYALSQIVEFIRTHGLEE